MKQLLLMLGFCLLAVASTFAQSPVGQWKTIDDETGEARSVVEVYMKEGKLYGKIVQLLDREDDPICDKCPTKDERYNQKVIGMEIIRNMEKDGDEWDDGTVLDPEKGKIYDCKLWIEEDNPNILKLRGYVGIFYRTQTWYRVK